MAAGIDRYLKAAKNRPAKTIQGTNKVVLATTTVGGLKQIRCNGCHGMMKESRSSAGKPVHECMNCGRQVTLRPL